MATAVNGQCQNQNWADPKLKVSLVSATAGFFLGPTTIFFLSSLVRPHVSKYEARVEVIPMGSQDSKGKPKGSRELYKVENHMKLAEGHIEPLDNRIP